MDESMHNGSPSTSLKEIFKILETHWHDNPQGLKAMLDDAVKEREMAINKLTSMQQEVIVLKQRITDGETNMVKLTTELKEAHSQRDEANRGRGEAEHRLKEAEVSVGSLREALDNTKIDLKSANDVIKALTKDREDLGSQLKASKLATQRATQRGISINKIKEERDAYKHLAVVSMEMLELLVPREVARKSVYLTVRPLVVMPGKPLLGTPTETAFCSVLDWDKTEIQKTDIKYMTGKIKYRVAGVEDGWETGSGPPDPKTPGPVMLLREFKQELPVLANSELRHSQTGFAQAVALQRLVVSNTTGQAASIDAGHNLLLGHMMVKHMNADKEEGEEPEKEFNGTA